MCTLAAVGDRALIILALKSAGVISCVAAKVFRIRPNVYVGSVIIGFLFATRIEHFAQLVGLWEYKPSMPVIPMLKTGLLPTLQLPLLTVVTLRVAFAGMRKA